MAMQQFEPMGELRRMEEMMNRLWRNMSRGDGEGNEAWVVPLDVLEQGDNIVIKASLPGVDPNNVQVTIENSVLMIKGSTEQETHEGHGNYFMKERRTGTFYRSLRLPDTIDPDRAESFYENGVLTIRFPKAEDKRARQIPVKAGQSQQSMQSPQQGEQPQQQTEGSQRAA